MSFPLIWLWSRCDFSFEPLNWRIAVLSLWFCFKDWACSRWEVTDRTIRGKKEGSMALRMVDSQHRLLFCSNISCRHGVPENSFLTVSSNWSLIHLVTCYNNPQLFWNPLREVTSALRPCRVHLSVNTGPSCPSLPTSGSRLTLPEHLRGYSGSHPQPSFQVLLDIYRTSISSQVPGQGFQLLTNWFLWELFRHQN